MDEQKKEPEKKIKVDQAKCIGCGLCVSMAPKTFKLAQDGKSEVIEPPKDKEEVTKSAAESCPVEAIKIEE